MKTYLVTGGTSGIGRCLVSSFKDEDVKLYLTIRNREKIDNIRDLINPEHVEFIDIDLSDVEKIKDVLSVYKSVEFDGFVHCAGYGYPCTIRKTSYENFDKYMRVNFYSFVELIKLLTVYKRREKSQAYIHRTLVRVLLTLHIFIMFWKASIVSAPGRGRTGTSITRHGILSPRRLPIPPLRHIIKDGADFLSAPNDPDRTRTDGLRRDRAAL